jgi:hypothetical protein
MSEENQSQHPSSRPQTLDYEYRNTTRGVEIRERDDGGVVITVPTRRRTFRQVLKSCASADLIGVVAAPLVWPLVLAFASPRPRAIVWLTPTELTVSETSDEWFGWSTTSRTWRIDEVSELRCNRYEKGIYMRVPSKEVITGLLCDLPGDEITTIGNALEERFNRLRSMRESAQ